MNEYFFIAVSTRENLELCKKYALAGFPSTLNCAWTYCEINEGDFVSFLYGAKAHNLYKVVKKEAIANAENFPPWKPLNFRESGKTVYFPFRLYLELIRELEEPIARPEFSYLAENLLQRGGYWKTHFQADQTTLQNVSQMGRVSDSRTDKLDLPSYTTFMPKFARTRKSSSPETYQFKEVILQSLIRKSLSNSEKFNKFLEEIGLSELKNIEFEVLGEKALAEGIIDILAKESRPRGRAKKIIIEVKMGKVSATDIEQLNSYMDQVGEECAGGILIAHEFPKAHPTNIHAYNYSFDIELKEPHTFEELLSAIKISPV